MHAHPDYPGCISARHTFGCPGSEWAAVIDDVIEGEGEDEERAVAGCVHLEGHVSLVQTNCLSLLGQRGLQQLTGHLRVPGIQKRKTVIERVDQMFLIYLHIFNTKIHR